MIVRNGKQIYFSEYDLEELIRELSVNILKNDPNFMKDVYSSIIKNASHYGIDTKKFCFDIKTIEKIKLVESQTLINHQHPDSFNKVK